jgi:hypothetical protein
MSKSFENKNQSFLPGVTHLNVEVVCQSPEVYSSDSKSLRELSISGLPDSIQTDEHWTAVTRYLVDMYLPKEG